MGVINRIRKGTSILLPICSSGQQTSTKPLVAGQVRQRGLPLVDAMSSQKKAVNQASGLRGGSPPKILALQGPEYYPTSQRTPATTAHNLITDQKSLLKLSLLIRAISIILLVLFSQIKQSFDTSHQLLSYALDPDARHGLFAGIFKSLLSFVRWDTVYFLASSSPQNGYSVTSDPRSLHMGGYQLEQTLAFQPGIVTLLRLFGYITPTLDGEWSPTSALLLTTLMANISSLISPVLLYRLTYYLTKKIDFAYTTAVLSLFAPTAATTLASPTPEAFFSFASLMGMLHLGANGRCRWSSLLGASLWFAVATAFRANGVLLTGFIAFRLLFAPDWHSRSRLSRLVAGLATFIPLAAICVSPLVLFQAWSYGRFCTELDSTIAPRPWCKERPPSVFTFVQSEYWQVGFLRYWQTAQLPNFALAAPIIILLLYSSLAYWSNSSWKRRLASIAPLQQQREGSVERNNSKGSSPSADAMRLSCLSLDLAPDAVPYVLHGLVVGGILLFMSHVQIALRFASPGGLPMVWWGSAHAVLHSKRPWLRQLVISYLALQFCASVVLYAGFYPPA